MRADVVNVPRARTFGEGSSDDACARDRSTQHGDRIRRSSPRRPSRGSLRSMCSSPTSVPPWSGTCRRLPWWWHAAASGDVDRAGIRPERPAPSTLAIDLALLGGGVLPSSPTTRLVDVVRIAPSSGPIRRQRSASSSATGPRGGLITHVGPLFVAPAPRRLVRAGRGELTSWCEALMARPHCLGWCSS